MPGLAPLLGLPHLAEDIERTEQLLRDTVVSDDEFFAETTAHLVHAGGKRMRPALALAAGHIGGSPASDEVCRGAVAVELMHLGSLYHDDVMDDADLRRGVVSANAKWGNLVAILAGDFLLSRASAISADLGPQVTALLAATLGRMCEGQVLELRHAFDVERPVESYWSSIAGKTASLFSASCRVGALAAGLPTAHADALGEYGLGLGLAFQVVDDVLDVVASDEVLGKPAGNDLAEGVYTLPVLTTLADAERGPTLRALLGGVLTRDEVDAARELVRGSGAVDAALEEARRIGDEAVTCLRPLGENPVAAALAALPAELLASVPAPA